MASVFGRLLLSTFFCVCTGYGSALGAEKNDADAAPEGQQTPEASEPASPRFLPFRLRDLDAEFSIRDGFRFSDEESGFNLHLGGRFYVDGAAYFEDKNSDLGDEFGIDNAQVEAEATVGCSRLGSAPRFPGRCPHTRTERDTAAGVGLRPRLR